MPAQLQHQTHIGGAEAMQQTAEFSRTTGSFSPLAGCYRAPKRLGRVGALIAALGVLVLSAGPGAVAAEHSAIAVEVNPATALKLLPADHPEGMNAAVRLVEHNRATNVHAPVLSTYIIDYQPGGVAVLHRSPGPGYVLVYVLSGSIRAKAWHAGVGFYHTGQTWVQTAIANDVTSENASASEPARALVVLLTGEAEATAAAPK